MTQHHTFSRLVQNDEDFIGMVAYSVYKKEKLNWIKEFKSKPHNNNTEPTQAQLDNGFNLDSDTPLKLERYRNIAETMLNEFMDEAISSEVETYQKNVLNEAIVKAVKKGFWTSVGENVFAGLVGAALIALFSLGVWLWQAKDNPAFKQQANQQIQNTMSP